MDCASSSRKSLETRLRRFKSDKDSRSLHASWLLESTGGQPTWKESWRPRLWETPQWDPTWFPKRLWKSTQLTQLWLNSRKRATRTRVTRQSRTWCGCFTKPHYWPPVSHWTTPLSSPTESTKWSNSDWASMTEPLRRKSLRSSSQPKQLNQRARWKKLIEILLNEMHYLIGLVIYL